MTGIVTVFAIILASIVPRSGGIRVRYVEHIEKNHCFAVEEERHPETNRPQLAYVERFSQLIFWSPAPEGGEECRGYLMLSEYQAAECELNVRQPFCVYRFGSDGDFEIFKCEAITETWTGFDPEVLDREPHPMDKRRPIR